MLTYNKDTGLIHTEQLSIVLGENYVISFQPDPRQDPFDPMREKTPERPGSDAQETGRLPGLLP